VAARILAGWLFDATPSGILNVHQQRIPGRYPSGMSRLRIHRFPQFAAPIAKSSVQQVAALSRAEN